MCQPGECDRTECGGEALRMYIKIDASTKRKLPTRSATRNRSK